jgi:hypothetical protein
MICDSNHTVTSNYYSTLKNLYLYPAAGAAQKMSAVAPAQLYSQTAHIEAELYFTISERILFFNLTFNINFVIHCTRSVLIFYHFRSRSKVSSFKQKQFTYSIQYVTVIQEQKY